TITGLSLYIAPLPTFIDIFKKRSADKHSSAPYLCGLLSSFVWTIYGSPAVANAFSVFVISILGLLFNGSYCLIFYLFSTEHKRFIGAAITSIVLCAATMASLAVSVIPAPVRPLVFGLSGDCTSTASFAAPLTAVAQMIQTRSVEFFPIQLCAVSLVHTIVWTAYGASTSDIFVAAPNFLALIRSPRSRSLPQRAFAAPARTLSPRPHSFPRALAPSARTRSPSVHSPPPRSHSLPSRSLAPSARTRSPSAHSIPPRALAPPALTRFPRAHSLPPRALAPSARTCSLHAHFLPPHSLAPPALTRLPRTHSLSPRSLAPPLRTRSPSSHSLPPRSLAPPPCTRSPSPKRLGLLLPLLLSPPPLLPPSNSSSFPPCIPSFPSLHPLISLPASPPFPLCIPSFPSLHPLLSLSASPPFPPCIPSLPPLHPPCYLSYALPVVQALAGRLVRRVRAVVGRVPTRDLAAQVGNTVISPSPVDAGVCAASGAGPGGARGVMSQSGGCVAHLRPGCSGGCYGVKHAFDTIALAVGLAMALVIES
ncbi:unnamed protein product, partial [Closterium sp. NIES-65]